MSEILSNLQKDKIGGLLSLDLLMLITLIIFIFTIPALYAVLKRTNESYALIALAFGLLAFASETVISNHALAARNEMEMLYNEFIVLAENAGFNLIEFKKLKNR